MYDCTVFLVFISFLKLFLCFSLFFLDSICFLFSLHRDFLSLFTTFLGFLPVSGVASHPWNSPLSLVPPLLASHLTTPPPPPRPHQSVHWFRLLCQLPPRRFPHCFHGLDPYFHDLLCFLVHLITLWKMSSNYLENRCVRVSFLCPFVSFLLLPHLIDGFDWVWIMKGDLFSPRALKALLCCILACLLLMEGLVLLILIPLYAVFLSWKLYSSSLIHWNFTVVF